jgi:hypothetical protein
MLSAKDIVGVLLRTRVLIVGLVAGIGVLVFSSGRSLDAIDAQIRSLQDKCQDPRLVTTPGRSPQDCDSDFRSWGNVPEPNVGGEIGRAQLTRDRLAYGPPLALGIVAVCALPWMIYLLLREIREPPQAEPSN